MKNILSKMTITLALASMAATGFTKPLERDYQRAYCNSVGGEMEVVPAKDRGVRIDCVTEDAAVEVDWAKKHFEGIGQSLYYGALTGKRSTLVLIKTEQKDLRYIIRARRSIALNNLPIDLVVINPNILLAPKDCAVK